METDSTSVQKSNTNQSSYEPGFPVPGYQFDQKNEMFKRALWDDTFQEILKKYKIGIQYEEEPGRRKLEFVFRSASWNTESAWAGGVRQSNSGLYSWEGLSKNMNRFAQVGGKIAESSEYISRIIKRAGLFFGADITGIARLHPNWIYSHEYNENSREHYRLHIPDECTNAIVMAVSMDYEAIRSRASTIKGAGTGLGYSRMAFLADLMAAFIRGLGYKAIPCGNDTGLSIPLALAAGLGEVGRLGLLITPRFGPRVRICKVFTDLPLVSDHYQPFGVERFCETCKVCANKCPSQAIPHETMTTEGYNVSNMHGVRKWYVNAEKCYTFWAKNQVDCINCISVCPFNKPHGLIHNLSRGLIKRTGFFNRMLVFIDEVMGYQKSYPIEQFWGDK